MTDMVERVAQAIVKSAAERGYSVHPAGVHHLAAAAIEAMREPTDAMVKVLIEKHGFLPHAKFWADAWNDGIDAALTPN